LPWHFIGVLFYLWMYSFAIVLTPTGRIKHYGIFVIFMALINLLTVYVFVPYIGLFGWMLKFIISPVLFFFIYKIYLGKQIKLKISRQNIRVMLFAVVGSLFLIFLEKLLFINWYFLTLVGLILSFLSLFFMTNNERNLLLVKLKIKK